MARSPRNVKSRGLGPLLLSDEARWEKEIEKVGKEQKSIEIGEKLLEKFTKTSMSLREGKFSAWLPSGISKSNL